MSRVAVEIRAGRSARALVTKAGVGANRFGHSLATGRAPLRPGFSTQIRALATIPARARAGIAADVAGGADVRCCAAGITVLAGIDLPVATDELVGWRAEELFLAELDRAETELILHPHERVLRVRTPDRVAQKVTGGISGRPASGRLRIGHDLLGGLDAEHPRRGHDDAALFETELVSEIGREATVFERILDAIARQMIEPR